MQYNVLRATKLEELIEIVNKEISAGWKPLGGISASLAVGATLFCQALVKEQP